MPDQDAPLRSLNLAGFDEFPILRTPRITLREITAENADAIFAMRANHRVNQFIARPEMIDLAGARDLVERTRKAYRDRQGIGWAGYLRDENIIMGTCGFNRFEPANLRAELGGEMAPAYWGKGLALEAVCAILRYGFETMGLHAVEARIDPRNRGAKAALAYCGFVKEAHFQRMVYFQGEFRDLAVYTVFEDTFREN
ncbi:MAG: GNAT family N-acetyltransferase [Bacteroidota bacterium]